MGKNQMINLAKPLIEDEEKRAVLEVLESGILAQGPRVKAFEEAFAKQITRTRFAAAASSGTTALHIALLAHGVGKGDEVITSAFTFIASANSILYTGARPIFVDIDPFTFNIDPQKIEAAITPRTKAIMPVHLFGQSCDMDAVLAIARKHNLAVIEDACQSHGAEYKGQRVGSFGTGVFSLYPTKNITSGEGGMITANDEIIDEHCRVIRNHGMRRRYYHDELGYNFRMTDLHAAIGLAQSPKLDGFNQKRREHAAFLSTHLKGVLTPHVSENCQHVYNQYTVRVPDSKRDALREHLKNQGVGSEIYYPLPVHKQSFYIQDLKYDLTLPETEKAAGEVLSLPVHPALSSQDLETIVDAVNTFFGG
jgi:perosamine synthetase